MLEQCLFERCTYIISLTLNKFLAPFEGRIFININLVPSIFSLKDKTLYK